MRHPTHPERLAFIVHGTPIPQGSKTVVQPKKGRATLRDANGKTLKPWRKNVREQAEQLARTHLDAPLTGPIRVWARFSFDRPQSHYRTGRNAHLLRNGAALYPTSKNDVDKLTRAIFDACTDAKVWVDDGQVVDVRARKFYAGEDELALPVAGVVVILEPLTVPSPADASSPVRAAGEANTQEGLFT